MSAVPMANLLNIYLEIIGGNVWRESIGFCVLLLIERSARVLADVFCGSIF